MSASAAANEPGRNTLEVVESRARHIAGAIHSRGAIPAWAWRQAIGERFLGWRIADPEWAELMIVRWDKGDSRGR